MVLYSVAAGLSMSYSIVFHTFGLKKYFQHDIFNEILALIVEEWKFIYLHWCIDAFFGLVQKCRAETSGKSSNHEKELFIRQEKVDAFLDN